MFLLIVTSSSSKPESKFFFVRDKDYFHNSRTLPLMRLTQKWMLNETFYGLKLAWHDVFLLTGWSQTKLPSLHRGISPASSCTSLLFTAVGSLDGTAAPIASLLMDFCMGVTTACVLMRIIYSCMPPSQVVDHSATGFDIVGTRKPVWKEMGLIMMTLLCVYVCVLWFVLFGQHIFYYKNLLPFLLIILP